MIDAPEKIWAWSNNQPHTKWHGLRLWAPFFPTFKTPTVRVFGKSPWWKLWNIPYTDEPVASGLTEYIRADLHAAELAKLRDAQLEEIAALKADLHSFMNIANAEARENEVLVAEIARLREALSNILDFDAEMPDTWGSSGVEWGDKCIFNMQKIARSALTKGQDK